MPSAPVYPLRLTELPPGPQPHERLRHSGPAALSDAELLAILLHGGVPDANLLPLARQMLIDHGGWKRLQHADYAELGCRYGVGETHAAAISVAIEISRRLLMTGSDESPRIRCPADVASLLMAEMGHLDQEHLRTVLLDSRNVVMAIPTISIGVVNSAALRVEDVFKEAMRRNATAMIVVHNRHSGDPTPSSDDIVVTQQIAEAGIRVGCDVLDHLIIIGHGHYVSMREHGLGFPCT